MKSKTSFLKLPPILYCSLFCCVFFACNTQNNKTTTQNSQDTVTTIEQTKEVSEESFRYMPYSVISSLNENIIKQKLTTADQIMSAYAPKDLEAEGNYVYTINEKELESGNREITLTEQGLMDDSIWGRKVVMLLTSVDGVWKVVSIGESYKCRDGRGHQNWSAEPCQ